MKREIIIAFSIAILILASASPAITTAITPAWISENLRSLQGWSGKPIMERFYPIYTMPADFNPHQLNYTWAPGEIRNMGTYVNTKAHRPVVVFVNGNGEQYQSKRG